MRGACLILLALFCNFHEKLGIFALPSMGCFFLPASTSHSSSESVPSLGMVSLPGRFLLHFSVWDHSFRIMAYICPARLCSVWHHSPGQGGKPGGKVETVPCGGQAMRGFTWILRDCIFRGISPDVTMSCLKFLCFPSVTDLVWISMEKILELLDSV